MTLWIIAPHLRASAKYNMNSVGMRPMFAIAGILGAELALLPTVFDGSSVPFIAPLLAMIGWTIYRSATSVGVLRTFERVSRRPFLDYPVLPAGIGCALIVGCTAGVALWKSGGVPEAPTLLTFAAAIGMALGLGAWEAEFDRLARRHARHRAA